jgi:hypothetical protein
MGSKHTTSSSTVVSSQTIASKGHGDLSIIGNIYIVSDSDSESYSKYKIGITKRDEKSLLRDYKRSRPEIKCHLFLTDVKMYKLVEKHILEYFNEFRIPTEVGGLSEWICVDLDRLIEVVHEEIEDIDEDICDFVMVDGLPEPGEIEESVIKFAKSACKISKKYIVPIGTDTLYESYRTLSTPLGAITSNKLVFCKYLINYISTELKIPKHDIKCVRKANTGKATTHYRYISIRD